MNRDDASGPQGTGFRNAKPDILFDGNGRDLDGSILHKTELNSQWFTTEMAKDYWSHLKPEQRDHFADRIRWRDNGASCIDRAALSQAAEGRDAGLHKLFGENQVRSIKAYRIQRQVKAAGPGSAGIDMPGGPSTISVTEIRTPLGTAGMDKLPNGASDPRTSPAAFMAYFGRPPANVPLDPWLGTPTEYHAFPDYLKTLEPRYQTTIIMNSVLAYGSWHMGVLCPPRAMTTNRIGTIKWEFNPGLAKRTAFEAPVTVLSHQSSKREESLIRFGLGIHMELGFWNTDLGRWLFGKQMEQLTNAMYLTMILMVEFALYHAPTCDDTLEQVLNKPIEESTFWNDMMEEEARFDAVHKPGGLSSLANTAKNLFRQRAIGGTVHMVMPESVSQSWKANGFDKNKEDPSPSVGGVHLSNPIRTDKHGETETSRNNFTHGGYMLLDPSDEAMWGSVMIPGKFQSDMIKLARWFDSKRGWGWTSYQTLFRRCLFYDYGYDNKEEDGKPQQKPRPNEQIPGMSWDATVIGRKATKEVGFQILANLTGYSDLEYDDFTRLYESAMRQGVAVNALKAGGAIDAKEDAAGAAAAPDKPVRFKTVDEYFPDVTKSKIKSFFFNEEKKPKFELPRGITTWDDVLGISLATSFFFDLCFRNNVPVFIPLADVAPHQQRQAQTIAFFAEGHGNMYIGYPMAEMSHDGVLATVQLSLWAYFKAVIDKKSVVNFHTAMPCGYDGGNDETFWGYEDVEAYHEFRDASIVSDIAYRNPLKSRFVIGMTPGFKGFDRGTFDISGEFNTYYFKGGRNSAERRRKHYPTAGIYAAFWRWTPSVDKQRVHGIDSVGSPVDNTICSRMSVVAPCGDVSRVPRYIEGTDLMHHLCWEGAQAVREGRSKPVPDASNQRMYLERLGYESGKIL
jgi:hypothetical protein